MNVIFVAVIETPKNHSRPRREVQSREAITKRRERDIESTLHRPPMSAPNGKATPMDHGHPPPNQTIVRKYTREQLLNCYRRFACPEGVEQHTAIYSLGTLLPEQLSPEPNYSQVLSVAPRAKRQISDLATRPRDPTNRAPVQVSHRPSAPGGNGGRSYRGPPTRGWGADDDMPPGPRQQEPWMATNDSPSERFAGMQTWAADTSVGSRAPTSRVGRGLISTNGLRQPETNSNGPSDGWNLNPSASLTRPAPVTSPHTAASWEKLGQKITTSPKIASLVNGKELRPDLSSSPPPSQISSMVNHQQLPPNSVTSPLPEQEPSWMIGLRRRFPKGLPEHVLQTLLGSVDPYTRGTRDMPPSSESSIAGDRFGSGSGASALNFKDLLHKAHGVPPAAAVPAMPPLGVVAASGMGVGEGPVISRVVRWSDNRPLYVVESISRAENLSVERANARHTVEYATDQYEARIILENYETRVAKLYQELLDMRRLWLPDPLAEHLGITESTSIALWPSFRELFNASQSEGMSRKLQAWEARQAQRQIPPQTAPFPQPDHSPPQPLVEQHSLWTEPRAAAPPITVADRATSPVMPPMPSPAQPTAPDPSSIPLPQTSAPTTWGDGTVHWWYLDPHQTIRGPYGSQKMFDWWQKNYFPADLPVRMNPKAAFAPLSTLYPPELQSRHRPFLSPPPLLPQLSPPPSQQPPVAPPMPRAAPVSVPQQTTTATPSMTSPATETVAPYTLHQPVPSYSHAKGMVPEVPSEPQTSPWDIKQPQADASPQPQQQQPSEHAPEKMPAVKVSSASPVPEQSKPIKNMETSSPATASSPPSQTISSPTVAQSSPAKAAAAKKKAAAPPISQIPERPQAFVQKHDTPALQPVVENRPMQTVPWARKKVAVEIEVDSNGVSALGPSLEESRLQDVMNRGGATPNVSGAKVGTKKPKAKPKKQTLLEILSDQQADEMATYKSPWGMKIPPPTTVWGESGSKRSSPETSTNQATVSAASNTNAPNSAARSTAAPQAQAAKTSSATSVPAKAPPAPIKQTPISAIVGQSSETPTASDPLKFSEPPTLNANQRKEISLLCAHHGIDLDADFLGVLAACETASDMNALLRDNLTVKDVQAINAFVEDFWDLVQNPFKPVKKGVANTITPKAGNKKRSQKRR